MRFSVRTVTREFTPAEAAEITGVSTTLQRDWRRRGILQGKEDGKWTRWGLDNIIQLSVMKLFSDAGMDVSQTKVVAAMAQLPTHREIALIDEAVTFDGDDLPQASQDRVRLGGLVYSSSPNHMTGRFLACLGASEKEVCRVDSLADLQSLIDREGHAIISVVDCKNLAALIVSRAGGAVIRYEIEITGE